MFKPRIQHRAGSQYSSCTLGIGKFVKCVLSCIPDENLSVKQLSNTFSVLKFSGWWEHAFLFFTWQCFMGHMSQIGNSLSIMEIILLSLQ
jgi:hypothetical protein